MFNIDWFTQRRILDDSTRAWLLKTIASLIAILTLIEMPIFAFFLNPSLRWVAGVCLFYFLLSLLMIFAVNRGLVVHAGVTFAIVNTTMNILTSSPTALVSRPLGAQLILSILSVGIVLGFNAAMVCTGLVIVFLLSLPLYTDAPWSPWVITNTAVIIILVLLLRRIAYLVAQLQRSNQREQQMRRVMRYFQHELSSYATALKGLVPLLPASTLPEKSVVTFNILERTVGNIDELLQELLILGREGDLGPQQRQKVVVRDVLEQVQQATRTTQQRDLPITIATSPDLAVLGNPLYLTLAVRAAVRNALDALNQRAVQRAPQVRLEAAQVGESVIISIEDSGPGFPPEIIAAFEQARARKEPLTPGWSSKTEGYGLGLALIDYIARLHGGKLDLGNLPGRAGAWVNIEIPAGTAADISEPEALAYGAG